MSIDYFDLMREALSPERLEAYRREQEDSDIDLISCYLMRDTFQLVSDRFPSVYHQGIDPHREYLQVFVRGFKDSY